MQGNAIGTNDIGFNLALGNNIGVLIAAGATNNVIGGTWRGPAMASSAAQAPECGSPARATTGNLIQGNIIGLRLDGSANASNNIGVDIGAGATGNVVGGVKAGRSQRHFRQRQLGRSHWRRRDGRQLRPGQLHRHRPDRHEPALGNGTGDRVSIDTASNNTVGGTVAGARNVISGNASTA